MKAKSLSSAHRGFLRPAFLFWLSALLAAFFVVALTPRRTAAVSATGAKHVLVISIDGLDARYLANRDQYGLKIPTLRKLMENGATASGVVGVYPSLTYPSHTTIVTGALPIVHGVFGNDVPGPPKPGAQVEGLWFAHYIKADALWDAAHRADLKTGLVSWPVATGAGDFNVPEIWKPGGTLKENEQTVAKYSWPSDLVAAAEKADPDIYKQVTKDEADDARARFASFIVETKRPDLMLVHLIDFDHWEHTEGPFTPAAFSILEKIDTDISRILDAYRKAGDLQQTTIFIVSDHGFVPVSQLIRPGVLLAKNGLVSFQENKDASGNVRTTVTGWKAYPYPTGGSCAILLRDPNDLVTLKKVQEIFNPLAGKAESGISKVFDRDKIEDLGANPKAAVMLEGADGYSFGGGLTGDLIVPSVHKGTHGYLPTKYEASFIASGAGIGRRGSLGQIQMISEGPTIAAAIGIALYNAQGKRVHLN